MRLDLAGDESCLSYAQYRNIFREAKRLGMPYTIHSGKPEAWKMSGRPGLGASRIGHGIALKKARS